MSWILWNTFYDSEIPYVYYSRDFIENFSRKANIQLTRRPSCYDLTLIRRLKNNKWYYGFMNKKGKEIIPCKYLWAWSFDKSTGLALVRNQEGKCGYIDTLGNGVIPFEYVSACDKWVNGKTMVFKDSSLYIIDRNNNKLRELTGYLGCTEYRSDKHVLVQRANKKLDLIDFDGNIIDKQGVFLENLDNYVNSLYDFEKEIILEFYKDGKKVYRSAVETY
ncbi:MAG: WG repeat-containing protein [Bacteroidales bacterium]|nr:WG repeat-containing protein [Bacteroidales bacterium]